MKKLLLVCAVLAITGCATTSVEVSEPIQCTTDCETRFENIKAMSTKFLGYTITHETKDSFAAQQVITDKGTISISAMNVIKTPEGIVIDVDTNGDSDLLLASNLDVYTRKMDFVNMEVHKTLTSVQYASYTGTSYRVPH